MKDAATVGAPPPAEPTRRRRLLPAAGIGILLGAIDGGVIAPILPAVSQALNTTHGLSWLASGYFLGTALGAPAWGGVGDARGHTFIISIGLAILFAGTLGCGAAGFLPDRVDAVVPVIFQFAFCRFLQGVGSAAIFTGAFALLPEMATPRQRARSTGAFSLIFAVATMLGPLLGGLINDGMHLNVFGITISGWRMVFFLQLPVVLLALALMTRERSAPRGAGGSFDAAGLALVALAAVSCMTAIESLRALREVQAGLAAALAAGSLVALHHVERRTLHPLLPPSLLELQAIRRPCISAALVGGALTAFALSIPATLQRSAQVSAATSGVLMAALSLGIAAGTFTSGRFVGRTGRARDAALVANATALLGLVAFNFSSSLAAPWLAAPLFLVGFGMGPLQPIQIVLMQLGVPAGRQGAAGGMLQFFRRLGSWAGAGAAGVVLAEYLHRGQTGAQGSPWPHLLSAAICAGFLAANLYVVWRMPRELIPE